MRKKSERAKLYDQIHAVMKDIRISGYGERCVICGSTYVVQLGHVIPAKASLNTRFDLSNTFPQCRSCNGLHRTNQAPYINWYLKEFGQEEFDDLVRRSRIIKKYNMRELRELLEEMKKLRDSRK